MEKKPGQEESTPKEKEQSKKTMYVVPSTLFSAMDRYVTLPVLAKEYKISIDILLERIAQKKLAGTRLGKTWLVRRDHFEQFLELYKQEKALDSYLASIEAKRKKVDKALSALEGARKEVKVLSDKEVEARKESVLWLKSSGLYGWMIKELSVLIPDGRKREVFLDVSNGKRVQEIAVVWQVSDGVIRNDYKEAIEILNQKSGFLKEYRILMSKLYLEIRKQELTIRSLEDEIFRLLELLSLKQLAHEPDWNKKPVALINMLSVSLEKLGFEDVTLLGFRKKGIETLEDLMWHIKNYGFESILLFKRVGKETLRQLKIKLQNLGLLNSEGEAVLFKEDE